MTVTADPTTGEIAPIGDREAYERACERLLGASDYQRIGQRKFKKRSAWRILANHYDLSCELVDRAYEREGRTIVRAEVIDRATSRDGRTMDGLGACDIFERCCEQPCWKAKRWADHECCEPDCPGTVHFSHPGHDIPSTAHTRARNRAVADLVGFGEVSAEEIAAEGEKVREDVEIPPAIGEPSETNVWLDVLGNPGEWEDLRHTKKRSNWPDFRALPTNEHWGKAGEYRGRTAPMAVWLGDETPDGFVEILALRDGGLDVDPELLELITAPTNVQRFRPEKPIERWTKPEIAEVLERDHGVTFTPNQFARTKKNAMAARLRDAIAAKSSAGETATREGAAEATSDDSAPVLVAAPDTSPADDLGPCVLCQSTSHERRSFNDKTRCVDLAACGQRLKELADETVEAAS